jgi:hypothetical protein
MSQPSRPPFYLRVAAGFLLLSVVVLAVPSATWATGTYCDWTYYSDATYTTIVGEKIKTCQNKVYTSGIVTNFKLGGCEACGPLAASQSSATQASPATKPLDIAPAAFAPGR